MNEKDEQAPFPREPWQRLLEDASDVPPETTDARIRAAARRDLAPRGHRWWLPASLAASFVLAVMIVRSEFGSIHGPAVTESDRTGGEAMSARIIDRNAGPEARQKGESPAAAPKAKAMPQAQAVEDADYGYLDEETGSDADAAGVSPRVGGPERELRSASEQPAEAPTAPPAAVPAEPRLFEKSAVPEAKQDLPQVTATAAGARAEGFARPPTPEAWYEAIEKLRAQGRTEEAERELERLKQAYPGWLERHLKEQKKP